MKKIYVFVLMMACVVSSMYAAGNRRGNSYRGSGGSYTHSVGGVVGNMFGASYKGFVFGVDGLALQADLAVKLQLSPTKDDIKIEDMEFKDSYNWSNYSFELNPNIVYQKEICPAGSSTFALYGGGGVSLGLIKSLNLASLGFGESNPVLGKFGLNGVIGVEFIWSHFVLSLDARPGYGLAFGSNKYEYRGGWFGEEVLEVEAKKNLCHFFDFGAAISLRYCF